MLGRFIDKIKSEPAVVIGLVASVIVAVAQQVLSSGIIESNGAINLLNSVVSVTPIVAGWIIRFFVSPAQ
jgi:hypothetical protein